MCRLSSMGIMGDNALDPADWFAPYRIRVVEPLHFTTQEEREKALERASYNLYSLRAEDVLIDLLTDSGTCAISSGQMAAMMRGDESYAGSASFYRMERAVQELFGFEYVIPTHQGRAAERLLIRALAAPGSLLPSNTLFDTTRANCIDHGVQPVDLPDESFWKFHSSDGFKGNMDCDALEKLLQGPNREKIPFILLTLTNNVCADQPVSMRNLRRANEIAQRYGKPLYLDACRFAQNAWFIQRDEAGLASRSIGSIVREIFSLADGCIVSAKKDAVAQAGGFLAVRSREIAETVQQDALLAEGFVTYGGITGRDMEAIAVGLYEGIEETHLRHRMAMTAYLHHQIQQRGVPVFSPPGGHAVYLPVAEVLPHLGGDQHAGQALAVELYREGGIRTTCISMHPKRGPKVGERIEFLRLALPSRVYTTRHLDYVAACMARVAARACNLNGMRLMSEPPLLGGFMAKYQPLAAAEFEISQGLRA